MKGNPALMHLIKHEVGGGFAIGPHEWKRDGDVCEVPDDLGNDLLRLGGYSKADPPKPKPRKTQLPPGGSAGDTTGTA